MLNVNQEDSLTTLSYSLYGNIADFRRLADANDLDIFAPLPQVLKLPIEKSPTLIESDFQKLSWIF